MSRGHRSLSADCQCHWLRGILPADSVNVPPVEELVEEVQLKWHGNDDNVIMGSGHFMVIPREGFIQSIPRLGEWGAPMPR